MRRMPEIMVCSFGALIQAGLATKLESSLQGSRNQAYGGFWNQKPPGWDIETL